MQKSGMILKFFSLLPLLLGILLLSGCGSDKQLSTDIEIKQPSNKTHLGVFLAQSPVEGVEYASRSFFGKTDKNGVFRYKNGDMVVFRIKNVIIGRVNPAKEGPVITPLALFDTDDVDDARVMNTLFLLSNFDEDDNSANGIRITDEKTAVLRVQMDLSQIKKRIYEPELIMMFEIPLYGHFDAKKEKERFQNELAKKSYFEKMLQDYRIAPAARKTIELK